MKRIKWLLFVCYSKLKRILPSYKRFLLRPSFPKNRNGAVLIHVGCGEIVIPGFINIDARPFPHVHVVTEHITDLSLFRDKTADLIYMCHVLEHVRRRDLKKVLWEMLRVLKPAGVLRLSVPDFDCVMHIYQQTGKDIEVISPPLLGGQDYPYNYHYSVFNRKFLSDLLRETGFREVRTWDPDRCLYHPFEDWANKSFIVGEESYRISLNLEAVK